MKQSGFADYLFDKKKGRLGEKKPEFIMARGVEKINSDRPLYLRENGI